MVIIVQPKLPHGYEVLGVGQVIGAEGIQTEQTVPVFVAAVEATAAGIISIGQVVMWPREDRRKPLVKRIKPSYLHQCLICHLRMMTG